MTIGELARRSGVPASRVRYYEAIGVLAVPPRRAGARVYDEADLAAVARIATLRRLGVPLVDLRSAVNGERAFAEVVGARLATVESELRRARVVRALLRHAARATTLPAARYDRMLAKVAG